MIELMVIAVLAFCAFVVVGSLFATASLVGWILSLPFRVLGLLFRGLGLLIGLPFVILGGAVAVLAFGLGALVLLLPLAPLVLLAFAVVWLVRHSHRHAATS